MTAFGEQDDSFQTNGCGAIVLAKDVRGKQIKLDFAKQPLESTKRSALNSK